MVKGKVLPPTGKVQNTKRHSGRPSAAPSPAQKSTKLSSSTVPSCCSCGVIVTDDTKALQCDRCMCPDIWKCAQCLNLTSDLYDSLVSDTNIPLRWLCDSCEKQAMDINCSVSHHQNDKLDHLIMAIEKLMNRYEDVDKQLASKYNISEALKLEERINQLEHRLASHESEVTPKLSELQDKIMTNTMPHSFVKESGISDEDLIKCVVQEEINRKSVEEQDLENRKRNIIVYRIPEKKSDNVKQRKESDVTFVKDLLDCVFDMKLVDDDVSQMYRRVGGMKAKLDPCWSHSRTLIRKSRLCQIFVT